MTTDLAYDLQISFKVASVSLSKMFRVKIHHNIMRSP